MDDNASRVIAKHSNITVENDVFDRFVHACEEARKPNRALLDVLAFTRVQDIK